jgi:hypothetical protein
MSQPPMSQSPNPFADQPTGQQLNPYAPPQVPGGQFAPPAGTIEFAPCPGCGNTWASKVGFTWWGGVLGPALFTHVKCARCGNAYNGKTGRSNKTAIVIYVAVGALIGLAVFALLALGGMAA